MTRREKKRKIYNRLFQIEQETFNIFIVLEGHYVSKWPNKKIMVLKKTLKITTSLNFHLMRMKV